MDRPQTRALRVESLETRELLSVAPVSGLPTIDPDAGFFEEFLDEFEEDDFDLLAANFDA